MKEITEITSKLIIDPPQADFVLVFSASWFVWLGMALFILALIVAFAPKKPADPKP